jgi:2'-phosphotransferase
MRTSCECYVELNLEKCLKDKMPVYISKNGVILSAGFNKVIEPKYFKCIKNRKGDILF